MEETVAISEIIITLLVSVQAFQIAIIQAILTYCIHSNYRCKKAW